jgi:hypothetical protein
VVPLHCNYEEKKKNGKWIQTHIGYQIGIINYCITIGPLSIDLAWGGLMDARVF